MENAFIANVDTGKSPRLIVTTRSVGSGSYLSVDAWAIGGSTVTLVASLTGLASDANPVAALGASLKQPERR